MKESKAKRKEGGKKEKFWFYWVKWYEWNWIMNHFQNSWFHHASLNFCTLFCGCKCCFLFLSTTQVNFAHPCKNYTKTAFRWFVFLDQKITFTLIPLVHSLPNHSAHPTVVSMTNSSCGISLPTSSNLFLFQIFQ